MTGPGKDPCLREIAALRERVRYLEEVEKEFAALARALKDSEERYRFVVKEIRDGIFIAQDGRVKVANPSMTELVGFTAEELDAVPIADLVRPEDRERVLGRYREILSRADIKGALAFRALRKGGQEFQAEVRAVSITWEERPAALCLLRDVTRQAHLESRLQYARKMEAVGTLAGGIAHDFNNILSAILGYAELSEPDLPPGHPVSENLGQISRAARRARDVVNQILAFSRRLEQPRRPTHLKPVLEEALDLLRATLPATIEITTDIAPDCPPVLADSTQMHQVVVNLATNAAHALKDTGGKMHLALKPVRCPAEGLPDLPPGDYVCLSVCDTGPGIDSAIQKRIFDPYFTTKPAGEGNGLGLAVVHGIVQAHGGRVHLDSAQGKGTCFHICLPRSADLPADDGPPAPAPAGGSGRILFVDDEETLVKLGRRFLEKLGYEVTGETSSRRALELFSRDPGRFDLIVTDQTMPQLTGMSLAESVWRLRPGLPIVISTGYSEQINPERSSALGFSALLPKPYSLPELSRAVEHCMEKGDAGQNTG